MKPVMYHSVRPEGGNLGSYPHLALADFGAQLDYFAKNFGIVSRGAFEGWLAGGAAPEGVLLTFDDGLSDHVEHVLPALRARGLFGLFYISSGPFATGEILDVHKVHLTLGRVGGQGALTWLAARRPDLMVRLSEARVDPYRAQSSDAATKQVKRLFNWVLKPEERHPALDELMSAAFEGRPPHWREFYADEAGIRELLGAGMGVGGHGHSHAVLGQLDDDAERLEIELSRAFAEAHVGSLDWGFCYPYGMVGSSGDGGDSHVAEAGWPFAFAVEPCDIDAPLRHSRRFALPRHNCNSFPYGIATSGHAVKEQALQ